MTESAQKPNQSATVTTRNPLKDQYVEIAARAEYEAMKCSVTDLEGTTWDTLPEHEGGSLPTPRCKQYYREDVSTAVEALWRAGTFHVQRVVADEYTAQLRDALSTEPRPGTTEWYAQKARPKR